MSNWPTPTELTETEKEAIVTELLRLDASLSGKPGQQWTRFFTLTLPERPPLFIKRCADDDVFVEASTQVFFHKLAKTDGSTPRVPRVLDAFYTDGEFLLVMEKVEAKTLESCDEEEAVQLAASAVQWLQDQLPFVPDTIFGRISSSELAAPVVHPFFRDHEAPGIFPDANRFATYLSKASRSCYLKENRLSTDEVLSLFGDHRHICHSDIKPDNFLLNNEGVWIIDFEHISVLPEVFQTFAYFNSGLSFAAAVGRRLNHQPSPKSRAMRPISTIIRMTGGGRVDW